MTTIPLKDMDPAMLVFSLSEEISEIDLDQDERSQIMAAAVVATHLHRRQTRMVRGNMPKVPYIEHPLRVTLRLVRWGVTDAQTLCAALLHDTVEDAAEEMLTYYAGRPASEVKDLTEALRRDIALDWLEDRFEMPTALFVHRVTNPVKSTGITYAEHIRSIEPLEALLIKASDLVDNAGSLPHQYGDVKDSFIVKRLDKYVDAVSVIIESLEDRRLQYPQTSSLRMAANQAIERLERVADELLNLKITMGL